MMRPFQDVQGVRWDIVLGRASWGAHFALFVPVAGGPVRQAVLRAVSYEEALLELDTLTAEALGAMLVRSHIKDEGGQ